MNGSKSAVIACPVAFPKEVEVGTKEEPESRFYSVVRVESFHL